MTISSAYDLLLTNLVKLYDAEEAKQLTNIVIEHITKLSRTERLVKRQLELTEQQINEFHIIQQQMLQQKPIQYILQEAWFYGMKFFVNESVLIPRPETEELIELIINNIEKDSSIIDIGTGSGCIPISLKRNLPTTKIVSIDISSKALEVAQKNATNLNTTINFRQVNFLEEEEWNSLEKFDVIVSNPPYIKMNEELTMNKNVLDYEPHLALFVENDDALIFYKKIISFSKTHLNNDGKVFVEINEALGNETLQLFSDAGFNAKLYRDMQEKHRMIWASKV